MSRYPPLTQSQLRELYEANPTPELRRVLFEVHRLHGVLRSVEGYRKTFEQAWRTEVGSHLVGLHMMSVAMSNEPAVCNFIAPPEPAPPGPEEYDIMFKNVPND